jgi:hypothetical protein
MKMTTATYVVAFVTACLCGLPEAAGIVILKRVGGWEAFGGYSNEGRKVCGMSTRGGGRWFGVKYFYGDLNLTIQLSKDTWKVRGNAQIDVTMQFDNRGPWQARATAFHMDDGDAALQFRIGIKQVDQWLKEFREGYVLYVRFPNSTVEDWQANLLGTRQIADAMTQCLHAMSES